MAKTTRPLRVEGGRNIITQGDEGDEFYILERGSADILVDDVKVGCYDAGSTFGEVAAALGRVRAVYDVPGERFHYGGE